MLARLLGVVALVSSGGLGVRASPYWLARQPVAWSDLTAEALAQVHPSHFATTVANEQIADLPLAACAGLTSVQLSTLVDNGAFTGLGKACWSQIAPSVCEHLEGRCQRLLTPSDAAELAVVPTDCSTYTSAYVASLTLAQISILTGDCLSALPPAAAGGLTFAAVATLSAVQLAALTAAAISGISVDAVGGISGDNNYAMTFNCAGLTAEQFAQLPTSAFYSWTDECSLAFAPAALGGWSRVQMRSYPRSQFWTWSVAQVAGLSPLGASGISPANAKGIPSSLCAGFNAAQIALFRDYFTQHVCEQWSAACLAQIAPTEYVGFTQECVQKLQTATVAGISAAQLSNLQPATFSILRNDQVAALAPAACAGITPAQMLLFDFAYPSTQCQALSPACINNISADAIAEATPQCQAHLPTNQTKA